MSFPHTKKIAKRLLPAPIYDALYNTYFRIRAYFEDRGTSYHSLVEHPLDVSHGKVSFVIDSFKSSADILTLLTTSVYECFSDCTIFPIASGTETTHCISVVTDPAALSTALVKLERRGFRFSIKGRQFSPAKADAYKLALSRSEPIQVHMQLKSPSGAKVFGSDVAIHIFVFVEKAAGQYVSHARNPILSEISGNEMHDVNALKLLNQDDDFSFDVDVVYTWVDGDDPDWQEKRSRYMPAESEHPKTAMSASRYVSRDELKYSIRSLLTYAPWVRNVYLVTDRQVPTWLKESERVQVIDHETIFEKGEDLPVFNSHAIEANLHRIPGLAENFLYFNDDVFLRQAVAKADFFTPFGRQSKIFYSSGAFIPLSTSTESLPVDLAAVNNARLLENLTGYRPLRKFQHTPIALKKSIFIELESLVPEVFSSTSKSRFRNFSDYSIASALVRHYALFKGAATIARISYDYINLNHESAERRIERLIANDKNLSCFCINDVDLDDGDDYSFLSEILDKVYSLKSPVEV